SSAERCSSDTTDGGGSCGGTNGCTARCTGPAISAGGGSPPPCGRDKTSSAATATVAAIAPPAASLANRRPRRGPAAVRAALPSARAAPAPRSLPRSPPTRRAAGRAREARAAAAAPRAAARSRRRSRDPRARGRARLHRSARRPGCSASLQYGRAYVPALIERSMQCLAQPLVRARELRLREARRAPHQPRNLLMRIPFDVVQPDDRARGVGQRRERALERVVPLDRRGLALDQ